MDKKIVISNRAKHIRLAISVEGVKIVIPKYIRNKKFWINKILKERREWIRKNIKKFSQKKQIKVPKIKIINGKKIEGKKLMELVKKEIKKEVEKESKKMGVSYKKIYIRNQKTLWGSCSRKSLSFNYKIYFLPKKIRRYIIIHELCHLIYPNHKKAFWEKIKKFCPEVSSIRKRLRNFCIS